MAFNKKEWKTPDPYGRIGWMYLVIQFIAFLLFFLASFTCWLTVSQNTDVKVLVGYWSRELPEYAEAAALSGRNRNYCVSWDSATKDQLFDGPWHFGRTVGVIGAMLSIPVFLISMCIVVVQLSSRYFTVLATTHVLMAVLGFLLLSGLGSDVCEVESCRLGPGGYLAIADAFLWIGAAFGAFVLAIRSRELEKPKKKEKRNTVSRPEVVVETRKPIIVSTEADPSVSETENEEIVAPKSPPKKKKRPANKSPSKKKKQSTEKRMQEP